MTIHPSATVEDGAVIGTGTKVWHQAHIRSGARVGRDCVIGKDVYLDTDVALGDRVKVQNGVSLYRGVTVADEAFIGPHATFTNDLWPRACAPDWEVVPTVVSRGASVGAHATVVCGVTLGPYCMVGAGTTVTSDVPPHAVVVGTPGRVIGYVCRQGHRLTAQPPLGRTQVFACSACLEQLVISYTLITEHTP